MSTDAAEDDCDFINVPAETPPLSPEEAIIRRHRKEKRDLQGTIQSMKKNVNKSDKKKKKDLVEEIAKMEADLDARHKAELDAFIPNRKMAPLKNEKIPETVVEESLVHHEISENGGSNCNSSAPGTPKMSRARRRREKKESDDKEKQKRIQAESFVLLENSQMKAEDDAFIKMMKDLTLKIVDVDPDGNCLYNAVKDQLNQFGESFDAQELRRNTAAYLRDHKDEFIMFMEEEYNSDEGFRIYCDKLESTTTWGGQLEVRILSQILARPIKVLQAEGVPVSFGDNFSKQELILTYHRHRYQLGEHYNSTKPA